MTELLHADPGTPHAESGPDGPPPRRRARRLRLAGRRVPVRLVVFAVLAVAVLAGFGWLLSWQSPVPLREVTVSGARAETTAELLTAADLVAGTAIRDVDAEAIEQRLTALPGIESAVVHWQRPFTIDLAVVERVPFATTGSATDWAVLDDRGGVIEQVPEQPDGLPVVTVAPDAVPAAAVTALAALDPQLRGTVTGADVAASGAVTITLDSGVIVDWGPTGDDDFKARTLAAVLPYAPERVNVSQPQRPALTGDLDLPKRNRLATPETP